MQKCENCSATFEAVQGMEEVTSLRILCPKCLAERKAARARKAGATPAAEPAPRAPEPTPRRTPPPPPAAMPVPAKAVRPAPKGPPAAVGTAAHQRRKAEAAAAKARRQELKEHVRDTELAIKKKSSREVLFGFLGGVLMLGVSGVVLYKVMGKKQEESEARQAALDRIEAFRSELAGMQIDTVEGAEKLLAFTEERKEFWASNPELNSEVTGRTAKAKNFIEGEREKATLRERFQEIEAGLAQSPELAPADLADLRRRIEDLAPKAALVGTDFAAALAQARNTAESAHVESLFAAAEKAAASEPLDRAALTSIQQAEDEMLKIFESVYRVWQKDMQNKELLERKERYEGRYRAVIGFSDDAVERFFTPEVVDNIPWRDLLSSTEASHWKGAAVKGFEFRVADGVLHMIGPAPEEKSEGIISIGDKEVWRDFIVDAAFTLQRGSCTAFFRLPPVWQEGVESFELTTAEGNLAPEQLYEYAFRIVGSTFTFEVPGEDPRADGINWTRVRKGAFGLAIPKESEIKFSRLRIKVLR